MLQVYQVGKPTGAPVKKAHNCDRNELKFNWICIWILEWDLHLNFNCSLLQSATRARKHRWSWMHWISNLGLEDCWRLWAVNRNSTSVTGLINKLSSSQVHKKLVYKTVSTYHCRTLPWHMSFECNLLTLSDLDLVLRVCLPDLVLLLALAAILADLGPDIPWVLLQCIKLNNTFVKNRVPRKRLPYYCEAKIWKGL